MILNVKKLFNKDRKDCKKDKSFLSKKKVDSIRKRKKYLNNTNARGNNAKEFSRERLNEDGGVSYKM